MHLGLYYDEAARKDWQERARIGEVDFDVNRAAARLSDDIRRAAEEAYDKDQAPASAGTGSGGNGGARPAAPATRPGNWSEEAPTWGGESQWSRKREGSWHDNSWYKPTKRGRRGRGGGSAGSTSVPVDK